MDIVWTLGLKLAMRIYEWTKFGQTLDNLLSKVHPVCQPLDKVDKPRHTVDILWTKDGLTLDFLKLSGQS